MKTKTVTIAPETKEVLRRGHWDGPMFILPEGQLERPLYVACDKVLKALGGKWNRSAAAHVFKDASGRKVLEDALEEGELVDRKKTYEQFFTPAEVASELIDLLGGDLRFAHVLEPSAGEGALIEAAFDAGAQYVTAIELDADLAHHLQHKWGGHSSPVDIFQGDFLNIEITDRCLPPYDVVLMNPPFSNNQDIDHVMHAFEKLRPGGRLGAIMSPHFTFASDQKSMQFRDFLRDHTSDIREIKEGAFKASGTNIRTVLVAIEKPAS